MDRSSDEPLYPAGQGSTKAKGWCPVDDRNPASPNMGDCQNYGPVLGLSYNTAPSIEGPRKGTVILTTTHMLYTRITTTIPTVLVCEVMKDFYRQVLRASGPYRNQRPL